MLRSAIIEDIISLRHKYPNFGKLNADSLSPDDYARMKRTYKPLLHYGSFGLPAKRPVANELIWKWTEASGKYVGCQFWSMKAKKLFDLEVAACGGWPITGRAAKDIQTKLSKKTRPKDSRLTHEHVYPIKDMKLWLEEQGKPDRESIRGHFSRQCVSCVILESEHNFGPADHENPWRRYAESGIKLSPNKDWSKDQRNLIEQAGLL
jgi:hypothetical protein